MYRGRVWGSGCEFGEGLPGEGVSFGEFSGIDCGGVLGEGIACRIFSDGAAECVVEHAGVFGGEIKPGVAPGPGCGGCFIEQLDGRDVSQHPAARDEFDARGFGGRGDDKIAGRDFGQVHAIVFFEAVRGGDDLDDFGLELLGLSDGERVAGLDVDDELERVVEAEFVKAGEPLCDVGVDISAVFDPAVPVGEVDVSAAERADDEFGSALVDDAQVCVLGGGELAVVVGALGDDEGEEAFFSAGVDGSDAEYELVPAFLEEFERQGDDGCGAECLLDAWDEESVSFSLEGPVDGAGEGFELVEPDDFVAPVVEERAEACPPCVDPAECACRRSITGRSAASWSFFGRIGHSGMAFSQPVKRAYRTGAGV